MRETERRGEREGERERWGEKETGETETQREMGCGLVQASHPSASLHQGETRCAGHTPGLGAAPTPLSFCPKGSIFTFQTRKQACEAGVELRWERRVLRPPPQGTLSEVWRLS